MMLKLASASLCKYYIMSGLALVLLLVVATNYAYCYHQSTSQSHSHHHHRHHNHHHHLRRLHEKRHADDDDASDSLSGRVFETNTYKKTVTTQNGNEKPVQTNYQWSTSSGSPSTGAGANDRRTLQESVRRITTTTLTTDDNTIDKKPIGAARTPYLGPPPRLDLATSGENNLGGSERINYNVTVIRQRGGVPKFDAARPLVCPANEFGNEVVGCRKCNCNDNIDLTDGNNCDPLTGRCMKCLYNTEGDHCERCKAGYTGDATKQQCRECVCNKLGITNPQAPEPCHPVTGQCACLPHVQGIDCGQCKPGYYDFASGKGCKACGCDSIGSRGKTCNELDGKCECLPGYGGRRCTECPEGQYGDPKTRCQNCQCHPDGSLNQICDTKSGKCKCRPGIGGDRCDKCARGYHGRFPNCEPCGECFDQWNAQVQALQNETQALLDKVKLLLEIGTMGAYAHEFTEIANKLDRIQAILDAQRLDEDTIRDVKRQLEELNKLLASLQKQIGEFELDADRTNNRTIAVQDALRDLDAMFDRLTIMIDSLRENATQFETWNVDGAYKIILDSQNRSREAEKRVMELRPLLLDEEQKRRVTENMFASTASRYNSSSLQNEAMLAMLARQITELENNVPSINQVVCASSSTVNNCDQLCGGALCNKCGGLSCSESAVTKANNALDLAMQATELLNRKYAQAKSNLDALNQAKNMSEEARRQAQLVMQDCDLQKSKFDKVGAELNGIMDGIDKFSLMDGARPAEVRTLGTECLALSISLKPEQILDLARKINETISSLTNIDKILQATADDLATAEQLHQQADRAKEAADNILETVELVLAMLRQAAIEQAKAEAAIAAAQKAIDGAQQDLLEISEETERLLKIVRDLSDAIKRLRDRLNELRKKYAQNELYVSQARAAADEAAKLTDEAERETNELAKKVAEAEAKLREKALLDGQLKNRAEQLKNDALQLAAEILLRMNLLRELDDLFDENVKRLKEYQDIIDDLHRQMDEYLHDIDVRAQYYRECQT